MHTSRRSFLKNSFSAGMLLFSGGMIMAACNNSKQEKKDEEVASCTDYSKLTEEELQARKKLGYTESSPDPEKHCKDCNLYKPAKDGGKCGGCMLFKGPVEELGTCTYWAPQAS